MILVRGWIFGWTIQLVVAAVLWVPLALISGWDSSWARAWAIGDTVRTWVWLGFWALLGGAVLFGYVQNGAPTRMNRVASDASGGASSAASIVNAADSEIVNVYDYTTTDPWTALVISTVAEFNAVRPPTAPRLVYVTAPGDADCLDIKNKDVWNLTGIIVCDTTRPEDFPYDPNAPVKGWGGFTSEVDGDTTKIVLNNFVPDGYYRRAEVADNTVCHEIMHAYLRGLEDDYDSDNNSCVFGDLLSPGTTDLRLMKERWPGPVSGRSLPERVSIDILGVDISLPGEVRDRVLPAIEPTATPQQSIGTGVPTASTRSGCDPAYPNERTCIAPGRPLAEPCAITDQRNFTVLLPDPRRLDADRDGIGCEPFVSE